MCDDVNDPALIQDPGFITGPRLLPLASKQGRLVFGGWPIQKKYGSFGGHNLFALYVGVLSTLFLLFQYLFALFFTLH